MFPKEFETQEEMFKGIRDWWVNTKNRAENTLKIEDIIDYGTKLNLPFVKDVKEKTAWSEEIISIR
ncbi:MAG: hypothetical protein KAJ44_04790 [Thermoplasmatales archaeon]|nr:hypothetical protein [Thermoplasmatales archaeon]